MPPVIGAIIAAVGSAVTAIGITGVAAAYATLVISSVIVAAGVGLTIWGVGTLISSAGSAIGSGGGGVLLPPISADVNALAPWNVVYGRSRVGGAIVFRNSFGDNDKYLDLVIVLACHPSESVDWLLFDSSKIQIGDATTTAHGWYGTSFTPLQQTIPVSSTGDITRDGSLVTVHLHTDIPLLEPGDDIIVSGVHPVNLLFNGTFPVNTVARSGGVLTITYLCGGPAVPPGSVTESGQVKTAWKDVGRKVYMEVMLGGQALGDTFVGMTDGTPYDGDSGDLQQNLDNPWTADCSLVGKTVVFLRLHYNDKYFAQGLPQISFLLRGKNDIYDPRPSPPTYGYSENAALCIADYLANTTWGYKAAYGSEIPSADLITAADICDEAVSLATGGTEPRYTCNGGFLLTTRRVEVLQNLLTACAGRLTYTGGQFRIFPGAWLGVSTTISGTDIYGMLTGNLRWKSATSVIQLFNGVKGTYISPVNKWQPADFPRYAQDAAHGYTWGAGPTHDANLDADGGDRRWMDVQLPFTTSPAAAQRIAKIELLRRRNQGTGTFPLNMSAYQLTPMDVMSLDLPFLGWSGKTLEVAQARLKLDASEGAPALSVEVDVQETDSSIYAWSVGEELSAEGYQQAISPDTTAPAPPTNVLVSSADGAIVVTWTTPADAFVTNGGHVEAQYQLVASPVGLWLSLAKMDPAIEKAEIPGLQVGAQYTVRVRSVNAAGVPSDWVTASPVTSSPLTPGPIMVAPPVNWAPNYETPIAGDSLFSAKGFGIAPVYGVTESGNPLPSIAIYGDRPADEGASLLVQVRRELVSGVFAQQAASVTTVDATHGTIAFGGSGLTVNAYAGRKISKLANAEGSTALVPIADFTVTANDVSGNFTVTPNPTATNPATGQPYCAAGDLFTLRTAPTAADATSFTDAAFNNPYNAGLTVHGNKGNLALVIAGLGAGQTPQLVTDNTGTKVTVAPGWDVIPDATSVIVLVEAMPQVSGSPDGAGSGDPSLGSLAIANYARQVVRVEGYTMKSGSIGPVNDAPFRELYIWGAQGTRAITASATMRTTDATIDADATAGAITYTCLAFSAVPNQMFTVTKRDATAHTVTIAIDTVANPTDAFDDGTTSVVLSARGDNFTFRVLG